MYLTAASAAWRYSGKVTGPDSRLSRPTLIGVPVALFSVPNAADASGVAVAADELSLLAFDDELSSPPHAETRRAHAASAARMPIQCLVTFMSLLIRLTVRRSPGRRLRRDSWNAAGHAGRAGPSPRLRARAVRGSARRRDRRPRGRARRVARRTGPLRPALPPRGAGSAAGARRSRAPARGSSRPPAARAAPTPARARRRASAVPRRTAPRPCGRGTSAARAEARAA